MGFQVREVRGLGNNSAFAKAIRDAAAPEVMRMLQETAKDAERRADEIVAREFNNGRSPDRRRPGPHLLGNFVGEANRTSGGNLIGQVTLRSRAAAVKVKALNYGSSPHEIGAGGEWLKFPRSEIGGQYKKNAKYFKQRKAQGSQAGGKYVVVKGPVEHPGTLGSHFLERALEQAVRARLRSTVIIPRR